ncbi:MAG: 6-hydroxymethylpterin diphosphokinase MptE-like protein, partial [Phycisphaerae bacterium]
MPDTVTPAVGNELFLHNMRALWRVDPTLALRVDAVDDHKRLPLEPTRSGAYTARVPTDDGGTVYLHSRYDPDEEARRLIDTVNLDDKFCILVSGLGLGYHVRALADRLRGDAFIICTEPALPVIATCLTCVDLADIIAARRLVILTDADKARLHERLKPHSATIMLGVAFLRHPASIRAAGPALTHIGDMIREFVDFTRMSLMTLIGNARITCRNIAMNLPTYLTTPPIDILRDRFTGDPAVVISAGPSLARNIDRLADLKGNAVLCAVQTTLKPLLQRGIVPDFVTSLDFHEISRQFF